MLIGFRGTGKTSIGKMLARELNYSFIDTDKEIEEKTGKKITQIFSKLGEQYFREQENKIIQKIGKKNKCVISCGGGAIIDKENVKILKKKGKLILLEAQAETIYSRIKNSPRPPITPFSFFDEIKYLLKIRQPFYENAADFAIDTTNLSKKQALNKILTKINEGRL